MCGVGVAGGFRGREEVVVVVAVLVERIGKWEGFFLVFWEEESLL